MRGPWSKNIPVAMSKSSSQILALKYYYLRAGSGKEQDMPGGDVSRNLRAYKNPLLLKSNENTGKNCQNKLIRTLEIDQGLIQKAFFSRKWLNLGNNRKLCGIWTSPVRIPSPHLHKSLENQQPCNSGENQPTSNHWRRQNRVGVPPKPHFQRTVFIWSVWHYPEYSTHGAHLV